MDCPLSIKQIGVIKAMMDSLTYQDAADRLNINRKTVCYHLLNARKKIGVNDTTRLLARCASEGWLK